MGADDHGKQELEAALVAKADIVVADSISQCVDHEECFHAVNNNLIEESAILELGHLIMNPDEGGTNDDQISIVDLTGVAIQDIQIAKMVKGIMVIMWSFTGRTAGLPKSVPARWPGRKVKYIFHPTTIPS